MSKYLFHKNKLEKWAVTVLFKSLSHPDLKKEVWYSLRYDRGAKQQNRGSTKPTKVQYGNVIWGHTATFLCSLIPKKDGTFEKKLLSLEINEHPAAGRMGHSVGKDIHIDLAKYITSQDREFTFPIHLSKTEVATVHLAIRAKKAEAGSFPSNGSDTDGTDTHPRSRASTVSAISNDSDFHSDGEPSELHETSTGSLSKSELDALDQRRAMTEMSSSFERGDPFGRQVEKAPSESSVRSSRSRRSAQSTTGSRTAYVEELQRVKSAARRATKNEDLPTEFRSPRGRPSMPYPQELEPRHSAEFEKPRQQREMVNLQARVTELETELRRRESSTSSRPGRKGLHDYEHQSERWEGSTDSRRSHPRSVPRSDGRMRRSDDLRLMERPPPPPPARRQDCIDYCVIL